MIVETKEQSNGDYSIFVDGKKLAHIHKDRVHLEFHIDRKNYPKIQLLKAIGTGEIHVVFGHKEPGKCIELFKE